MVEKQNPEEVNVEIIPEDLLKVAQLFVEKSPVFAGAVRETALMRRIVELQKVNAELDTGPLNAVEMEAAQAAEKKSDEVKPKGK